MGKWADFDFKEWNNKRKKGLKNPVMLWGASFLFTIALTALPSVWVSSLPVGDQAQAIGPNDLVQAVIDNLYTIMITQSVVTMLQNFAVALPSRKKEEEDRPTPDFSWTIILTLALLVYAFAFPFLILWNPPWLTKGRFAISGLLALFGLISIAQMDKEQERVRERQRAKELENAGRDLQGAPAARSGPSSKAAEKSEGSAPVRT